LTEAMIYVVLGLIWLLLFVFLGIKTPTNGHWVIFLFGIFFPLLWLIGALMPDHRAEDRVPEAF
jgi:ABC-type multidrug transport system permease subunit